MGGERIDMEGERREEIEETKKESINNNSY